MKSPNSVAGKIWTRAVKHIAAPLAARFTSSANEKYARLGALYDPVFILGPPRCGSTILYQALTNYYDVLYFDNLAARWAGALGYGMGRSMSIYGRSPHDNFTADLGTTSHAGWHAPSECGALWYRWIPPGMHYVGREHVTGKMVSELRDELHAVQNRWHRPLIVKNLHVGQRLAWVTEAFPNARFICLHRDHTEVVDSIMNARHRLRIPADELWSTEPADASGLGDLSERDMVGAQVARVGDQIERDLGQVHASQVRHVRYEDLSPILIEDLGTWLQVDVRPDGSIPTFGRQR